MCFFKKYKGLRLKTSRVRGFLSIPWLFSSSVTQDCSCDYVWDNLDPDFLNTIDVDTTDDKNRPNTTFGMRMISPMDGSIIHNNVFNNMNGNGIFVHVRHLFEGDRGIAFFK